MKLLIIFTLILSGLGALFYFLWQQTLPAMADCQDRAIISLQNDLNWVLQDQRTQADLCRGARRQYQELSACYQAVSRRYLIPTSLIETVMVKKIPNYPSLKRNQTFLNRACPN